GITDAETRRLRLSAPLSWQDKGALSRKRRIRIDYVTQYFFAPAAVSRARLTATATSRSLYSFCFSGLAPSVAASPAFAAVSSVISLPSISFMAVSAIIGVGAT